MGPSAKALRAPVKAEGVKLLLVVGELQAQSSCPAAQILRQSEILMSSVWVQNHWCVETYSFIWFWMLKVRWPRCLAWSIGAVAPPAGGTSGLLGLQPCSCAGRRHFQLSAPPLWP